MSIDCFISRNISQLRLYIELKCRTGEPHFVILFEFRPSAPDWYKMLHGCSGELPAFLLMRSTEYMSGDLLFGAFKLARVAIWIQAHGIGRSLAWIRLDLDLRKDNLDAFVMLFSMKELFRKTQRSRQLLPLRSVYLCKVLGLGHSKLVCTR
jgi:hypothetical protein